MERVKLLQNPLPIDRVAARVVKKAKPENLWRPMPRVWDDNAFSTEVIRTKELHDSAPQELRNLIGRRRDRLTIVGFAEEQPTGKNSSGRWVVRCDCGNYEGRSHILRWLGTPGTDHCIECEVRRRKRKISWDGEKDKPPIHRKALTLEDLRG